MELTAVVAGGLLGAIVVWILMSRRRRRMGVYSWSTKRPLPWPSWPERPTEDEREQMQLRNDPLLLIDRSPLVRVVGGGETQTADGVTIECISVEVRESGCRALLRAVTPRGGLHGPWRAGSPPVDHVPRVEDDLGTAYTVTMPGWTGGERASELLFRFAPPPPVTARRIVIRAPKAPPFALPAIEPTGEFVDVRAGA